MPDATTPADRAADLETLQARLASLEQRLARAEDRQALERLQYVYGYYIDNRMWEELAALFCDGAPSIEIGRRGRYVGRDRIARFLREVLGGGRWGLLKHELINHIQLQPVITIDDDGRHARMRSRAIVQGHSPPGSGRLLWAEGVYENRYVKQHGEWRLEHLGWVPSFYVEVPGFEQAVFESGPASGDFPPDAASTSYDAGLGRAFLPFHYAHPVTGRRVPSPSTADPHAVADARVGG